MKNRSAPGNSTPTSKRIDLRVLLALPLVALGAIYLIAAFSAPNPWLRILLRCLPVLPVAIWTIWFDPARPLDRASPKARFGARLVLLVAVMLFSLLLLGIGLNWLYDPSRVF